MQVYQELISLKAWLISRNWPQTKNYQIVSSACDEVWQLTNKLENNLNTLLAKSKALTLVVEVQHDLALFQNNARFFTSLNPEVLSETVDKLVKIIDVLLQTQKHSRIVLQD
ncbi:MAG: hypothetical protein ACO1OF_16230 [Adhaeribacter sp.]